jgi:molybdopterin-guanine dinucleotide biosynthesis protein A
MAVGFPASAIVLAGGRSARMGRPKATLRLGGITLIERTVAELARVFEDIVVVAAPQSEKIPLPDLKRAQVVRDENAYDGPAAGLARGIRAIRHEVAFACSCDLPMLRAEVAGWIVDLSAGYDAAIPRIDERPQLLHAAYGRNCADALESMLARGEYRLGAILDAINVREIPEFEYRLADPDALSCFNINTPEDYTTALRLSGL